MEIVEIVVSHCYIRTYDARRL